MGVLLQTKTSVFPCNNGVFRIFFRGSQKGSHKGSYNGTEQYIDIFRLFLKRTCNFENKRYVPPPFYSISFIQDEHSPQPIFSFYPYSDRTLFFRPKPVPVPYLMQSLKKHTIVTWKTGSGKSELMKVLRYILQYQSHRKEQYSMILLDPHGDVSEQILTFRLNLLKPNRVLYIDPHREDWKIPCINPFRKKITDKNMIDLMSQQFAKALSEMISEAGLSLQMETLLKPCLAVLFQKWECGLSDLQTFMDDSQNEKRVELGRQSENPAYRQFFQTAFLNGKYHATKLAVYTRIQNLQNNYSFYLMMNWPATVDIRKMMNGWKNDGKLMLFNLWKGKLWTDASKALGIFISATVVSIALQRAFQKEQYRKPCYLFVDEFASFATADSYSIILSETRKYKLYLIALTQSITQLPTELRNTILNNVSVKIVWANGFPALKAQANDLGISSAKLQFLAPFHFFVKNSHYPWKQIKSPDFLLKRPKKYSMNGKQLQELKKKMVDDSTLYRTISPDSYQTKYSKIDENSNPNYSTKDFVSDKTNANKTQSSSQNRGESTTICKPEFKL